VFFTRIGKFLAHLGFWTSLLSLLLGSYFAYISADMEQNLALARRYLGTDTTGEAIDRASRNLLLSIALGVLCEISARRSSRLEDAEEER
jgi:hypothetical protein